MPLPSGRPRKDQLAQAEAALQRVKDGVIAVDVRARNLHDLCTKSPILRSWFLHWAKSKTTSNCPWDEFETARVILLEFNRHPPDPELGRQLVDSLLAAGRTQKDLAAALQIPLSDVSEVHCGRKILCPDTIARLRQDFPVP